MPKSVATSEGGRFVNICVPQQSNEVVPVLLCSSKHQVTDQPSTDQRMKRTDWAQIRHSLLRYVETIEG